MQRDVCDRNLTVNTGEEEFAVLEIRLRKGGVALIDTQMSICPECEPTIIGIILNRIMLTDTPDDVKHGTLFTDGSGIGRGPVAWSQDVQDLKIDTTLAYERGMEAERSRAANKPGAGDMGG